MCTLLVAHRLFPGAPLVVAANRDELLSRPASGPKVYCGSPRVLAPRDEVSHGTWLGLNERGLFVGITNRFGTPPDRSRTSRGLLVQRALAAPDALTLHRELERLRPGDLNPFHLLYADGRSAFVTWSDGERLSRYAIEPGLHVITERSLGADDCGRTERLTVAFRESVAMGPATIESLSALLRLHGPTDAPLEGSCVHLDALGYGTRSAFVYVADRTRPRAAFCEGRPCEGRFADLSALLNELHTLS